MKETRHKDDTCVETVDGNPDIVWKVREPRDEANHVLHATVPMKQNQHHNHQIGQSHVSSRHRQILKIHKDSSVQSELSIQAPNRCKQVQTGANSGMGTDVDGGRVKRFDLFSNRVTLPARCS
jgi:hypothetical protein